MTDESFNPEEFNKTAKEIKPKTKAWDKEHLDWLRDGDYGSIDYDELMNFLGVDIIADDIDVKGYKKYMNEPENLEFWKK